MARAELKINGVNPWGNPWLGFYPKGQAINPQRLNIEVEKIGRRRVAGPGMGFIGLRLDRLLDQLLINY
jgi:hypothetical protein